MASNVYLFQDSSTVQNIAELFGLLFVFVVILVLAYLTSKWIAKNGAGMTTRNHNITIVETLKISPSKYLQIVKVADKHIVIAVSKDHVEYLTEIDGDKLEKFTDSSEPASFKEVLSKIKLNSSNHKTINKSEEQIEKKDKNDV